MLNCISRSYKQKKLTNATKQHPLPDTNTRAKRVFTDFAASRKSCAGPKGERERR